MKEVFDSKGNYVDRWYDRHQKTWVAQLKDNHAIHAYTKPEIEHHHFSEQE